MDVLSSVLSARQEKSQQVQALLDCLAAADCRLDVCICSVGGVGSTELSNFLTRVGLRVNLLTDQDTVRHTNRPPALQQPGPKVVYLFGDPLAAVASHYRRGHALHQAQKTSGHPNKLDAARFPSSFQEYIDRGEDLFGLEQHLQHWLATPTTYDVLFVRYEAMFDLPVAEAMFGYLCSTPRPEALGSSSSSSSAGGPCCQQPQQLAAAFAAQKKERASRVTPQQRQQMYVRLAAQMDALPPVFLRTADCQIRPLVRGPCSLMG